MPISGETYRQIGQASAGAVSVVAAYGRDGNSIFALTVSSFVTLSFEPPLVMFAIQHDADSYAAMMSSRAFGVSLLSEAQIGVARLFATKGVAKTASTSFDQGSVVSVPLIPEALAQIECRTSQMFMSGDHAIVVGLVEAARTTPKRPLLYFSRQFGGFRALDG